MRNASFHLSPLYISLFLSSPPTGELSLSMIDKVQGTQAQLWKFIGMTDEAPGGWVEGEVYVGARDHRFQVQH